MLELKLQTRRGQQFSHRPIRPESFHPLRSCHHSAGACDFISEAHHIAYLKAQAPETCAANVVASGVGIEFIAGGDVGPICRERKQEGVAPPIAPPLPWKFPTQGEGQTPAPSLPLRLFFRQKNQFLLIISNIYLANQSKVYLFPFV